MKKQSSEFANFDRAMRNLIRVPHDKLKAALDAEKRAKERKKKLKDNSSKSAS